jgi:cytosylglucuronate decarboxylase
MCHFAGKHDSINISDEQFDKILNHIKKYNYKMIRFTGGEPLLHKNIVEYITKAKKIGVKTSIITNGYLLPVYADKLINSNLDECIISLDGSCSCIHDNLRNFDGCFDNIIKGIKLLKKYDIIIRINTVVSGKNIHDICNIYELLVNLGVDQWSIIPIKYKENIWTENSKKFYDAFVKKVSNSNKIKFLGYSKNFAGLNDIEINDTFNNNSRLKVRGECKVIDNVRFYIPDMDLLIPCNCVAHRLKEIPFDLNGDMEKVCEKIRQWLKQNTEKCKCEPLNVYINDHPEIFDNDEILY